MSPNLDLQQGISYLERERGREIKERDRKIGGRGSETAVNKNPKQSWVAHLVTYENLIFFFSRMPFGACQKDRPVQIKLVQTFFLLFSIF
jgi:hypothetical protein